jgi:prolyl oligopeptidase
MMLTSAEGDSRVDPMHARKMAARMQDAQEIAGLADERPILLRIEPKAGHGAGKPTTQLAEEATEELAFLFAQLGMREASVPPRGRDW